MGDEMAVILPAAGRSARFGGGRNKLQEMLEGKPVIEWAVKAFLARADVASVIIATGAAAPAGERPVDVDDPRILFTPGGSCRSESVLSALRRVGGSIEWVAVHDAARPLVSQTLIDRVFAAARQHGAAAPALPVALTVKQAQGPLPAKVERTLPRQSLWAMQTPQIMRRADLLAAYDACPLSIDQVTDDVQLLELAGKEVWLVEGEEQNLKLTTPADLAIARHALQARQAP